jgi:hypothetical protein
MNLEDHLVELHWEHGLKSFLTAAETITNLKNEVQMWKDIAGFLATIIGENKYLGEQHSSLEQVIDYAIYSQGQKESKNS